MKSVLPISYMDLSMYFDQTREVEYFSPHLGERAVSVSVGVSMVLRNIEVNAEWNAEARVWMVTSDDVPGLITQAATMDALWQKLKVMIPTLIRATSTLSDEVYEPLVARIAYGCPQVVLCSRLVGFA